LIIARRLEAALPKARIFEIYLNVIEWGDGIWGAEAAARTYFGVPASALNAEQSALLAGAIINPRALNPAHPTARLIARRKIILSRMGEVTPPTPEPVIAAAPDVTSEELPQGLETPRISDAPAPDQNTAEPPSAPASVPLPPIEQTTP
jgi:monofunctional biosynthetic peptidoglycan transglycosylase